MFRVEDKFVVSLEDMLVIEKRIEAFLKKDYYTKNDGYTISSVYFDDMYSSHYEDTLDGVDKRDKYRIRIYNNSFDTIKLETKYKQSNRILKISDRIDRNLCNALLNAELLPNTSQMGEATIRFIDEMKTSRLSPRLIVTYDRNAYVYEPGNVRITFDRNVRFSSDVKKFGDEDVMYDYIGDIDVPSGILEIKYDEFCPQFIKNLVNSCGRLIQISYSKYALCNTCMK